jgi:hypothetical protein
MQRIRTDNHSRHPELVSGSIPRITRFYRRQAQPRRQIVPVRVFAFDQIDLPLPTPVFQLLLARDGGGHVVEQFVADEAVDAVLACEARNCSAAVLPQAGDQVAGHADVEGAVRLAGEDVDAGLAFGRHNSLFVARWMLKQVQHDGMGAM